MARVLHDSIVTYPPRSSENFYENKSGQSRILGLDSLMPQALYGQDKRELLCKEQERRFPKLSRSRECSMEGRI